MPTSRMRPDGTFTVSTAQQETVDFYALTYQALPWVEASFRYSIFNPGKRAAVNDDLRDRSFEIKVRLVEESDLVPSVSVGLRDMFGTGVWAGEYVVGSKRLGSLDISAGVGWGRFAQRGAFKNPLRAISDSFEDRSEFVEGEQGQLLQGQFFRGPDIGAFGGFSYDLPRWNLRLIGEYSSDAYEREQGLGYFRETSPFGFGISWAPLPGVSLTASHQLGQDFVLTLASSLDTKSQTRIKERAPFFSASEPESRLDRKDNADLSSWYARLLYDVERSGVLLLSADVARRGTEVCLEVENIDYQYPADAIRQVLQFAEIHLPEEFRSVVVILQSDGVIDAVVRYQRALDISSLHKRASDDIISILPVRIPSSSPRYRTGFKIPNGSTSVNVSSRFQLMDPDDPLRYQVLASIDSGVDLGQGWYFRSSLGVNLYNDFGDISRSSDSVLPRVRSDIDLYLKQGETGIGSMYMEKRGMVNSQASYRAYAGILEDMYSGVGAEVLWRRRFDSRIAFGFNANWVQQRDFDRGFGHRDFETTTAHASLYWATPFDGYDFAVHMGRYLARDVGATFEVRRTFDNGWMIGAFATLTDVPFDEFGEGSFDKGLFFRIPFNSLFEGDTRGSYSTLMRLLQRDGGQRLENFGTTLWWESRPTRMDALVRTLDRMVPN